MSRSNRFLLGALTATAVSCGDTSSPPPSQLNLDRPVDISFACYGGLRITDGGAATPDQDVITTAQAQEACNVRSGPRVCIDPDGLDNILGNSDDCPSTEAPVPVGQEPLTGGAPIPASNWYGFILQSGPGTVAIARFPNKPGTAFAGGDVTMLDADPLTPGKNGISVGEDPIAIVPDAVGCWQVIANAGSCDLSGLEVNSALDQDPSIRVNRIPVKNANGVELRAKPAAMVAEPTGGVVGAVCAADHPTGIVYVAYPSCHLVAAVDTATGVVVGGVRYDLTGVASVLAAAEISAVTCPAECDGGGGGAITSGTRPVALDLDEDVLAAPIARRLLIGADNSPSLTLVELDEATSLPESLRPILLETTIAPPAMLGVTTVAIAPQIGMGGASGVVNDDLSTAKFNFAYAITTDDTIRVVDLDGARECDTQVDPRLIDDNRNISELSCLPITPGTRRPGVKGPGIELVVPALRDPAIPTSIEIFRAREFQPDGRLTGPSRLIGYFGIITASNGASFVLNVDDDDAPDFENAGDPLEVQLPLVIAHQLRDALPARDLRAQTETEGMLKPICDTNGPDPDAQGEHPGGPRATTAPTRNVPAGTIAAEKVQILPGLRQVLCTGVDSTKPVSELSFAAPDDVRDLVYPDLRAVRDETWTMTWEGSLSLDKADSDIDGPAVRVSQIFVDQNGFRIVDQAAPFCDAGVEQYDIVQLRGCDPAVGDAECPLGYTCFVHPNSEVANLGACMLVNEADRLADACRDFLTTQRRYTVGRAASGELRLLARKSVLRTTPLDGCTDDAQCEMLGDYASELASASQPFSDTSTDTRTWACRVDTERAPLNGVGQTGKRCIEVCGTETTCSNGRVCQNGTCMEGVTPPQACVNAPQRYELRASEAFTVVGTRTGYVHSTIRDTTSTDKCTKNPAGHPFEVGRIPLNPPPCDPTADPRTGRRPDGSFGPNPCSTTVAQSELAPVYTNDQCAEASPATALATRTAPAIAFRNRGMNLTLVDPTYPGDGRCIRDRIGTLPKVPVVFPGYQLSWRQVGGFAPLILTLPASYPVKVVRGPTQSIWVIDEGDFLSTSGTQSSTRGNVFRVEPQGLNQINILDR